MPTFPALRPDIILILFTMQASHTLTGLAFQGSHAALDTLVGAEVKSIADSTSRQDSVKTSERMLPAPYSIEKDSAKIFTREELHWLDYASVGDIIARIPGWYVRDQVSPGQYNQLNFQGTDWRSVTILNDGRIMNDPATGIFNLHHIATEHLDGIEVVQGPRSFLYGLNGSGGAINLRTRQYDSNRPFSSLFYSESPYEYSDVDGTFSQNVTGDVNLTLGIRHQGIDGRFPNSFHDLWNARVKIRYALTNQFSLSVSENHVNTETQLNGGIDPFNLSTAFFPLDAIVKNGDAYEKINRNDVDVSLAGSFFPDGMNPTRLTLYYSSNFREYRDENGGTIPNGVFIQSDHTSSWMGAQISQDYRWGIQEFFLESNVELRQIEGSPNLGRRRNVIGHFSLKDEASIGGITTLAAYGRYDRYLGDDFAGFGADVTVRPIGQLSLFAGASFSHRLPSYQELYWVDSTVSRIEPLIEEKHALVEVGGEVGLPFGGRVRATLFERRVADPLLIIPFGGPESANSSNQDFFGLQFINGETIVTRGAEFSFEFRHAFLLFEGSGTFLAQETGSLGTGLYPEFAGWAGAYFQNILLDGDLDLKAGIRSRYQSGQTGAQFNGKVVAYLENPASPLFGGGTIEGGGTLDIVAIGRIGSAYLHFVWQNLTEATFFTTPFYPVVDRSVRFGVSWAFLD